MNAKQGLLNRATTVLMLAVCALVAYQAAGTKNMAAPATRVAVVQLKKVMDSIQQRATIDVRMKQLETEIIAEEKAKTDSIKAMQEEMKSLVGNDATKARQLAITEDPAYMALTEKLELATLNYMAWQQFTLDKVDLEKSLIMQDLYRQVKQAIGSLAQAEGYDLVIIDDSQGELQVMADAKVSREAQVQQQISLRKLLYASAAIDITEDVITRMNNEFNVGPAANAGGANR